MSFVQEYLLTPIITNINCNDTKMCKNDVVGIVTFDLIGLLLTNHIIAQTLQINGIPEFI